MDGRKTTTSASENEGQDLQGERSQSPSTFAPQTFRLLMTQSLQGGRQRGTAIESILVIKLSKSLEITFPTDYQLSLIILVPLEEQVGNVVALGEDSEPWDGGLVERIKICSK